MAVEAGADAEVLEVLVAAYPKSVGQPTSLFKTPLDLALAGGENIEPEQMLELLKGDPDSLVRPDVLPLSAMCGLLSIATPAVLLSAVRHYPWAALESVLDDGSLLLHAVVHT
jgi:hypothetical protein